MARALTVDWRAAVRDGVYPVAFAAKMAEATKRHGCFMVPRVQQFETAAGYHHAPRARPRAAPAAIPCARRGALRGTLPQARAVAPDDPQGRTKAAGRLQTRTSVRRAPFPDRRQEGHDGRGCR